MSSGAWWSRAGSKSGHVRGPVRNLFFKNTQTGENIEENGRDDWIRTSDPLTPSSRDSRSACCPFQGEHYLAVHSSIAQSALIMFARPSPILFAPA
jgi:hypothetical protein